jgi:ribosomal protein S12 methylthiotransferase accessory factor YcaO
MSDYWTGLVNYKQGKAHRYFRAQVDDNGEAIENTICEVNFTEERDRIKKELKQELMDFEESVIDGSTIAWKKGMVSKIIEDKFKGFE